MQETGVNAALNRPGVNAGLKPLKLTVEVEPSTGGIGPQSFFIACWYPDTNFVTISSVVQFSNRGYYLHSQFWVA